MLSMPCSTQARAASSYRFHARDVHLVLGPGPDGKPVRFRVTIDGLQPGQSQRHGRQRAMAKAS